MNNTQKEFIEILEIFLIDKEINTTYVTSLWWDERRNETFDEIK